MDIKTIEKINKVTRKSMSNYTKFSLALLFVAFVFIYSYAFHGNIENNTFLILQTTVDTYSNMIIAAMPYKENAEMYQALRIGITLREIQQVSPSYSPAPADSNPKKSQIQKTTNKGDVQSKTATEQQQSTLSKWFNVK